MLDLANHLREEWLYVSREKQLLRDLNDEVIIDHTSD